MTVAEEAQQPDMEREAQQAVPLVQILGIPVTQPIPMNYGCGIDPNFPEHVVVQFQGATGTTVVYLEKHAARQLGAGLIEQANKTNGSGLIVADRLPPT